MYDEDDNYGGDVDEVNVACCHENHDALGQQDLHLAVAGLVWFD